VDNEGDYVLENTNTGARASMYFTPCGWFSSGRYEVPSETDPCLALGGSKACRHRMAVGPCDACARHPSRTCRPQVSGHISTAEGNKVFALGGKWNEYLDAQRCDEEGNPLPDAEKLHLWKVRTCPMLVIASGAGRHLVHGARRVPCLLCDAPLLLVHLETLTHENGVEHVRHGMI
jgi:hypothetical protein